MKCANETVTIELKNGTPPPPYRIEMHSTPQNRLTDLRQRPSNKY